MAPTTSARSCSAGGRVASREISSGPIQRPSRSPPLTLRMRLVRAKSVSVFAGATMSA